MIGELLAFAALLMFASNILITKVASGRLNVGAGFLISVTVNIAFAVLVFCVELALRRDRFAWDATGIVMFVLAGICATWLGRWFFFEAIARLGPAKASLFQVASPAFTVLIAWLFLGEALRPVALIGVVLAIAGLFLVSAPAGAWRHRAATSPSASLARPAGARWRTWLASGAAMGAASAVGYALGAVVRGASVRQWNEPVAGALIGAVAGLALHLVIGSGHRSMLREIRAGDPIGVRLYALGGVLTITAQMCTIAAMRHIPVAIATVITLCTPLVVLPASYFLLRNRERIGLATLAGAVLTMAGMAVIVLA